MNLEAHRVDGTLVVTVRDSRIDAASAVDFKDALRDLIGDNASPVTLDLGDVDFVDSSGLGALVAIMKVVEPAHRFEVSGLQPNVEKVFRLTRMDSIMNIAGNSQSSGQDASASM